MSKWTRGRLRWGFRRYRDKLIYASIPGLVILSNIAFAQHLVQVARSDKAETKLRVYAPQPAEDCTPLALISPGAGGTEEGYSYLAEGLQSRGWLAIVVGHKESGPQELRGDILNSGIHGGLERMVTDPALHRDRLMDVGAALKWANQGCKHPVKALLGHSMGSDTVMFEAGAKNKLSVRGEDRFDIYVALSPSGPGSIFPDHAWSGILKPLYILTGTRDKGLEGSWEWRTKPFDDLPAGCKWLGVIDGASHMNFAGRGIGSRKTEKITVDSIDQFLREAQSGHCDRPPQPSGLNLQAK